MSERDDTKVMWAFILGLIVGVVLTAAAGGALALFQLRHTRAMAVEAEMRAREAALEAQQQRMRSEEALRRARGELDESRKKDGP
jgi:hypothetical protein